MELDQTLTDYFARQPDLAAVQLFGSAAGGVMRVDSDIDLAVLGQQELSARRKLQLIRELGELTGRAVDIIDLRRANGPVLREALVAGRSLLRRDPLAYSGVISRMLAYETDVAPMVRRMESAAVKSWLNS